MKTKDKEKKSQSDQRKIPINLRETPTWMTIDFSSEI